MGESPRVARMGLWSRCRHGHGRLHGGGGLGQLLVVHLLERPQDDSGFGVAAHGQFGLEVRAFGIGAVEELSEQLLVVGAEFDGGVGGKRSRHGRFP